MRVSLYDWDQSKNKPSKTNTTGGMSRKPATSFRTISQFSGQKIKSTTGSGRFRPIEMSNVFHEFHPQKAFITSGCKNKSNKAGYTVELLQSG